MPVVGIRIERIAKAPEKHEARTGTMPMTPIPAKPVRRGEAIGCGETIRCGETIGPRECGIGIRPRVANNA